MRRPLGKVCLEDSEGDSKYTDKVCVKKRGLEVRKL
jgi:hypothetical protein